MLKIMVRHKLALAAVWALSMTGTSAHGDITHACVLRTTGALRVIDANKSCSPNERAIRDIPRQCPGLAAVEHGSVARLSRQTRLPASGRGLRRGARGDWWLGPAVPVDDG